MLGDSASGFVVAVVTMFSIADIIAENAFLANKSIAIILKRENTLLPHYLPNYGAIKRQK